MAAEEAFFWVEEQYLRAWETAEEAGIKKGVPDAAAFRRATELVWSRCLRVTAGEHGVRRMLVPLLDMANHDSTPSAMYAYANTSACGGAVRLYAAQALAAGAPVTITYGEHNSAHFAQYYGFVPARSSRDEIAISHSYAAGILGKLRAGHLRAQPDTPGWISLQARAPSAEAIATFIVWMKTGGRSCSEAEVSGQHTTCAIVSNRPLPALGPIHDSPITHTFAPCPVRTLLLQLFAPTHHLPTLLQALTGIAELAENFYAQSGSPAAKDAGFFLNGSPPSEAVGLLLHLRLSRKLSLNQLARNARSLARVWASRPEVARRRLRALAKHPSVYPKLDLIPVEEIEAWANKAADWS